MSMDALLDGGMPDQVRQWQRECMGLTGESMRAMSGTSPNMTINKRKHGNDNKRRKQGMTNKRKPEYGGKDG